MKPIYIPFWLLLFAIAGCSEDFPQRDLRYIEVNQLKMETTEEQGSNKHNFKEVWAYANGNYIGAFQMPAKIPVLGEGETLLSFFPGYRLYGLADFPDNYPFGLRYDTLIDLSQAPAFLPLEPIVRINPTAKVRLSENFESGNTFTFRFTQENSTTLTIYEGDAFDGTKCGRALLTKEKFLLQQGNSVIINDFPINGVPAMIEVSYKSDVPLGIGIMGYYPSGNDLRFVKVIMFPRSEWNRVYVPIEDELRELRFTGIRVLIEAAYDFSSDKEIQEVLVDEIKFIHF
jgi:hypothetical protein